MSLLLNQLASHLNTFLDISSFEDKAINGIQIANEIPINHIATAVTSTLEAIEKAVALKAQALIVHHGIFCKGDGYQIVDTRYKKIKLLIENNVALLCYHLPLDAHQDIGNNWKAARDLGLQDLTPWFKYTNTTIGVIGSITPTPFDEFIKKVEQYYGNRANKVKTKEIISSVGIVSGGAHKLIDDAVQAPVDCFITGTVDEPVWDIAHEKQISFLGLGHYATETIGVQALAEYLQATMHVQASFIKTDNPF